MSSPVQVRNVPDETRRALKARAASRGESLNAYLLDVLEREASRPTVADVLARARARSERSGAPSLGVVAAARAQRASRQ